MKWPLIQAFISKAAVLRGDRVSRIKTLLRDKEGGFVGDFVNSGLVSWFERCLA